MAYVFDPDVLAEVARGRLGEPRAEMFRHIREDLALRYPGRIGVDEEWVFSNAGGVTGMFTILYASFSEYVIIFGTPVGTTGYTGSFSFAEDHAVVLDGEMRYYREGQLECDVYRPGDRVLLPRGAGMGFQIVDGAWILEYARGAIPTMLPFGLADSVFSTVDLRTVLRTLRLYAKHLIRWPRSTL